MRRSALKAVAPWVLGGTLLVPLPVGADDVVRGGAVLSPVSSIVKISRDDPSLQGLQEGDELFIFTQDGEPVSRVVLASVFTGEIHSDPLPDPVAGRIREEGAILVFSNVAEYGDFIKAYLNGGEEAFRSFIARFPGSPLRPEAQRVLDGILFRPYKIRGTVEAYQEFLARHPDNVYRENALERRDSLLFDPYRSLDRVSGFREFLKRYPENRLADEARERMEVLLGRFRAVEVEELSGRAADLVGKDVRFTCFLQSVLPVYVEGPSVGKKAVGFQSPRNSLEHVNFQGQWGNLTLWRLFLERDRADLVTRLEGVERGGRMVIYGQVFSALGNAPWVEVEDLEVPVP